MFSIVPLLFSKRWFLTTLAVIVIAAVCTRLGFWQLDRLEQRKAHSAHTLAQINAPLFPITPDTIKADFLDMEYRQVSVTGHYDYSAEVLLRNQVWIDKNAVSHAGVHLLTPLIIDGTDTAVLVDRGWIPLEETDQDLRAQYAVPGKLTITGIIRLPQSQSEIGLVKEPTLQPGESERIWWNFANIASIQAQLDNPLIPVYIQEQPQGTDTQLPYTTREEPDLSSGAHLGFAFQWFMIAVIFLIGYPRVVSRQLALDRQRVDPDGQ